MNAKEEQICEAALRLVARYGVRKTTMGDIAEEAGVSRQTLYNSFSTKDDVVLAVVTHSMSETLESIVESWSTLNDFADKMDVYFEKGALSWFDSMQASPDLADVIEGEHAVAKSALAQASTEWVAALKTHLFADLESTKAENLADFVFNTSKNAKYGATSREQVANRLNLLKELIAKTYSL